MRVLRHAIVFLMLTTWVVVKEHCNLEAAGMLPTQCSVDCGETTGDDDGCSLVEKAYYKHTVGSVMVLPPVLALLFDWVAPLPENVPLPALAPERTGEPEARMRTWRFVERAAPPSRAPTVIA